MEIHPLALTRNINEDTLRDSFDRGLVSAHAGNGPTRVFILGGEINEAPLEISCVIKNEDVLVYHAAAMRPQYRVLLAALDPGQRQDIDEPPPYGLSADEIPLTEGLIQELYEAAEQGHDAEWLGVRTRPGRPAPMSVGKKALVGLPSEIYAFVEAEAQKNRCSMAFVIATILQQSLDSNSEPAGIN